MKYWYEYDNEVISNIMYYVHTLPRNIKNWFRFRLWERHHIVKTGLKPDYWDADTRILYATFAVFNEFMTFQRSDKTHVKWFYTEEEVNDGEEFPGKEYKLERNKVWKELCEIHDWWLTYESQQDDLWKNYSCEKEQALEDKETEMLIRLTKLRKYLWD